MRYKAVDLPCPYKGNVMDWMVAWCSCMWSAWICWARYEEVGWQGDPTLYWRATGSVLGTSSSHFVMTTDPGLAWWNSNPCCWAHSARSPFCSERTTPASNGTSVWLPTFSECHRSNTCHTSLQWYEWKRRGATEQPKASQIAFGLCEVHHCLSFKR